MLNIITVEGPSNTGKSTLLDLLEITFKDKKADVYRLSVSRLDDGIVNKLQEKVSIDDMKHVLNLKLAKEATVKLIDEYRKTRAHSLLLEITRLKHAQLRAVMASFEALERDSGLGNTYLLIDLHRSLR